MRRNGTNSGGRLTVRCSICGVDHPIEEMEPAFARPDAYVALSADQKENAAKASNDLCRID